MSTMPMASISANIVVGPTHRNPRAFSSFDSATDSSLELGTSDGVTGAGVSAGWKLHTNSARSVPSDLSATVARALSIVARIFARLRMMPASSSRRATSSSPNAATASGSNSANAARKVGLLRSTVAQLRPDWNASRLSLSNTPCSSRTGIPHSVS